MKPSKIGSSIALITAFALLLPPVSHTQTAQGSPSPQDSQQPEKLSTVLRANTRLVVLDAIAVDDRGNPVTDLKQEDFTVLEDGKPQNINSFSFQRPTTGAPPARSLAPGVVTNAPQYGSSSLNIILLDAINTDFSNHAYAQDMLIKYLETGPAVQPTAVFALEGKLTLLHDFTTDTRALRDAVANFKPQGPTHIATVEAAASPFSRRGSFQTSPLGRTVTFNAMTFLAKALAGYPGRKNLIWLSEGFPISLFPDVNMDGGTAMIEDYSPLVEKIADDLMNAQVALYPIDAAGVSINDRFSSRTAMVSMAQRTGGKTFYNRNDIDMGVRTSIDDGATYYNLTYYSQNHTWDNKFRHVELKLARSGVHLRYREGYYAQAPNTKEDPTSLAREFTEAMLLDAPPSTGVLFQAAAVLPAGQAGNNVVVNFAVDPHTLSFERDQDDLQHADVTCSVAAYPSKGEAVRTEHRVKAAFKADVYQQVQHSYFPCKNALNLKPGKYKLRLGVLDMTTNSIGTTTTQITVP
jgi:VWFA-related protein